MLVRIVGQRFTTSDSSIQRNSKCRERGKYIFSHDKDNLSPHAAMEVIFFFKLRFARQIINFRASMKRVSVSLTS